MKKSLTRRVFSILLAVAMVVSMFGSIVGAEEVTEAPVIMRGSGYDPTVSEAVYSNVLADPTVKPSVAGALSVTDSTYGYKTIGDKDGNPIQLRGMSTHGLQWYPAILNDNAFDALSNEWGANVIRLAMYVGEEGYNKDKDLIKSRVINGIELAKKHDMYVIVDWHVHAPGDPTDPVYEDAIPFFDWISDLYPNDPYIIYEVANEPSSNATSGRGLTNNEAGWTIVKNYAQEIIDMLRDKGNENLVIVGSPNWSQRPDLAADDPIVDDNTVYAIHFYTGSHAPSEESYPTSTPNEDRGNIMSNARYALENGVGLFASEWGTSEASGDGGPYIGEADVWIDFLNEHNISWTNWSLANKPEISAAFMPSSNLDPGFDRSWEPHELTISGEYVRTRIQGGSYSPVDRLNEYFATTVWNFNDGTNQGFGWNADNDKEPPAGPGQNRDNYTFSVDNVTDRNSVFTIKGLNNSTGIGPDGMWSNMRISSDGRNPAVNILGAQKLSIDVIVSKPATVAIAAVPQSSESQTWWENPTNVALQPGDFILQESGDYSGKYVAQLDITRADAPSLKTIAEHEKSNVLTNLVLMIGADGIDEISIDNITFSGIREIVPVMHDPIGDPKIPSDFEDGTRQGWAWNSSGHNSALTIEEANGSKALSWEIAYPTDKNDDPWSYSPRLMIGGVNATRDDNRYLAFDFYLGVEQASVGGINIELAMAAPEVSFWIQADASYSIDLTTLEELGQTEDGLYHFSALIDLNTLREKVGPEVAIRDITLIVADNDSDFAGRMYMDNIRFTNNTVDPDVATVAADKAALEIAYADGDSQASVTKDVYLPTAGEFGSSITWTSSDTGVIDIDGTVNRKSSNVDVTLTATITRGKASDEKEFKLTVRRNSRGGGSGGGGSAGGGSSSTGDAEVVTNPNAVNGEIVVSIAQGKKKVLLPANADAINRGNKLKIEGEDFTVQIPGDVLEQLKALLSEEDLAKAQIAFEFDEIAEEDQEQLLAQAADKNKAGLKAASALYSFTLSIVKSDGEVTKLSVFEEPITLILKVAGEFREDLFGMYFLAEEGSLEYAGGTLADSKWTADVTHFSTYAVLEYDKQFADVSADYWAADVIKRMAAKHIVTGVSVDQFAPKQNVTRAEFAALLVRGLELKASGQAPFADVDAGKWYAESVAAAYEAGIVSGRSATEFAPNVTITREEMAIMIVKAYERKTGQSLSTSAGSNFADSASISTWAAEAIDHAAELGLLQGRGDNLFVPRGLANRAESVQVIAQLLDK